MKQLPSDHLLPLTLKDVREATDMYIRCDSNGALMRDFYGLAVVLNARVKAFLLTEETK